MKKNLYNLVALLALSCTLFLSACSKGNGPVTVDDDFESYLSAKIEGQEWGMTTTLTIEDNGLVGNLSISGSSNSGAIELVFRKNELHTGTIHLSSLNKPEKHSATCFTEDGVYSSGFHPTGGTCTITILTKNAVAGTFEFYGQEAETGRRIHITDGKFGINLRRSE